MQPRYNEATTRRTYPRRKVTFPMSYAGPDGASRPAFGLNVGGGGVCMLAREAVAPLEGRRLELYATLGGARSTFEAVIRWQAPIVVRGETEYRLGIKIASIPDKEWDTLMAFSLAEGNDGIAAAVGSILTTQQRDSMLPVEKQQRIAARLMEMHRLTNPGDGRLPLIEYIFSGYRMLNGVASYRLKIRSKTVDRDGSGSEYHTNLDAAIENAGIIIS
jgi:hypothetical protein